MFLHGATIFLPRKIEFYVENPENQRYNFINYVNLYAITAGYSACKKLIYCS